MSAVLRFYTHALKKYPILVQSVQTGFLMGFGDVVAQKYVEKKTDVIDWKRTAKFSSVGFFIAGPGLRFWYGVLNKYIGTSGKSVAIKKVLADQLLFAPCFLLILVGVISYTQCYDVGLVQNDLEKNYLEILKTNYYVWPWVQLGNFYFIPFQYQVLVAQTVAVFWNTYLSWKTNEVV